MNLMLITFVLCGAAFGLATLGHRHLFSEGGTPPQPGEGWSVRLLWLAMCTLLWPLFALTGAYGAWHRRRMRAAPERRR